MTGSSGKESSDGSRTEREIEKISPRHSASGETVRSIVNSSILRDLSPRHHACHGGSESLVRYLIIKGASGHARDSRGDTSPRLAANFGPASLVIIRKDASADWMTFNDQGVKDSEILGKKEAAAQRAETVKNQQKWYSHLVEELSDNKDTWWGAEWGDEPERLDWKDPILEKMAESRQGGGLHGEPVSPRHFLKAEKKKAQSEQGKKSKRTGRHTVRPLKDEKRNSPEAVIGPTLTVSVETHS